MKPADPAPEERSPSGAPPRARDEVANGPGLRPVLDPTHCEICGAPVDEVHCKIVCRSCGFVRDCSDP